MGFDRRAYRSLATKEIKNIRNYFDGCHYCAYNSSYKNNNVSLVRNRMIKNLILMISFFNMGFIVCYAITIVYRRESKSMRRKMFSRYVTCQYKSLHTIFFKSRKTFDILNILK